MGSQMSELNAFEIIEKKSRFLGYAANVKTEVAAKEFIAKVAAQHKKARHVAYAYVLAGGAGVGATAKMSDDGEPKGSAGLPIYNVITRRGLQDVVIVVVRYFGGVLLGKGGLIRAYGKAAGGAKH